MVDGFFCGHPLGLEVFRWVERAVASFGEYEVKVSATQVAFVNRRGFAFVWMPGRWLRRQDAEVVLSIAAGLEIASKRFKEVVHPSRRVCMHHLEVSNIADLDDEVVGWLRMAYEDAA